MADQEVTVAGEAPVVSLSGVSATGRGTVIDLGGTHSNHSMVVTTSAGVSAGSVALQGSLDGTNWVNLGTAVTTNAASTSFLASVSGVPMRYLAANVATGITGGTVSATVAGA